jgi:hypothetical protein
MWKRSYVAIALIAFAPVGLLRAAEDSPIQDNSFLIEEAYNQEQSVVQHINTFSRMWNSKDWSYTFTQEWPGPNWRHQLSYTLSAVHNGQFPGAGLGDVILNYRYQLVGSGKDAVAFAPRFSLLLPTGKVGAGQGNGGIGVQANLPLSVVLHPRLVTHWNAGATYIPHAQSADHMHAGSIGYNFGESFIILAHPRVNLMLETVASAFQSVEGPQRTTWAKTLYVSPGIRWAYNFRSGLQIVPGVAMPVGAGPSRGERGLFLYLSFEHPFRRLAEGR